MPADAVRPVSSRMRARISAAVAVALAMPRRFSVTSRYASSSDSGSMSDVYYTTKAHVIATTDTGIEKLQSSVMPLGSGLMALPDRSDLRRSWQEGQPRVPTAGLGMPPKDLTAARLRLGSRLLHFIGL